MNILVEFLMINAKVSLDNTEEYVHRIVKKLIVEGLITNYMVGAHTGDQITSLPIRIINDNTYAVDFIYSKGSINTHWQLVFEFGTFTASSQLKIGIGCDGYKLDVENNYLERLKLTIKDIIQLEWEKVIWLIDKDSELLSITLYPHIYRVENLARQLINEIMTKEYGIDWWERYVPEDIKNKHKARLGGYKSEVPGFNNVDERLMSIDLKDLGAILTLLEKKWNPQFNLKINNFLNNGLCLNIDAVKKILADQTSVTTDLWKEQFSRYLTEDFKENFHRFELNRNHVVHNKLIDRVAYKSISKSIKVVEGELTKALKRVSEVVISKEEKYELQQELAVEREELEAALQEIMEAEAGINIRSEEGIIDVYNKHLYEFHSELEDYLRFRNDLEITEYQDISAEPNNGLLFEIKYRINDEVITINYEIDCIDGTQGQDSSVDIIIKKDDESVSHCIGHTNGEASFNTDQGCYLPEREAQISLEDFDVLKEKLIEFIQDNFENMRESVDADMYRVVKDGGNSPVAEDIACCECGEEYICIEKNYGRFGQCLSCGEMHEITQCERCGCYFDVNLNGHSGRQYGAIDICGGCIDDYKHQ